MLGPALNPRRPRNGTCAPDTTIDLLTYDQLSAVDEPILVDRVGEELDSVDRL